MPLTRDITADSATAHIRESFEENDPLWAIARALQSIAITQTLILARMDAGFVALADRQDETNKLLSAALGLAIHAIRYGDTMGMGDALDSFTVHPREPWPGPCGTTETPND